MVIIADESMKREEILDCIRVYPFINLKVVFNCENCPWRNIANMLNVGIREATKQYILILDPKLEFYTDVIYELREKLDFYPEYYAIGQIILLDSQEEIEEKVLQKDRYELKLYGGIMAKKEYFERIGSYSERYMEWGIEDEYLRSRLELAGIRRLFFPDVVFFRRKEFSQYSISYNEKRSRIPFEIISEIRLPVNIIVNEESGSNDSGIIIYDWKDNPYAKEQCRNYLSTLKQFDIPSDEVFDKSYHLVALIPTYNEAMMITDCLVSVEKYCDGIILLDDDSTDNTYQISQVDKLLVKAKKNRTEFNDKQNRNILLDMASFFKADWFIFIDADERFDERFIDLKDVMKKPEVDIIGVWIANLWNNMETYRTDMADTTLNPKNGLWFRWRMFRNKGRMQIRVSRSLHFPTIPYADPKRCWSSKTLLVHLGYLDIKKRLDKYDFYQMEDKESILNYNTILSDKYTTSSLSDIQI